MADIPLACFCGGIGLVVQLAPTAPSPPPAVQPLIFAAYILPLIAHFMLTGLIAGRIWWMTRGTNYLGATVKGRRKSAAFKAAMIIIESGVLYFVVQLIYLTVFAVGNSSDQLMSLVAVQIYVRLFPLSFCLNARANACVRQGIAPTLIIIQVGLGFSSDESTRPTITGTGLSFVRGPGISRGTTRTTTSAPTNHPEKHASAHPNCNAEHERPRRRSRSRARK